MEKSLVIIIIICALVWLVVDELSDGKHKLISRAIKAVFG